MKAKRLWSLRPLDAFKLFFPPRQKFCIFLLLYCFCRFYANANIGNSHASVGWPIFQLPVNKFRAQFTLILCPNETRFSSVINVIALLFPSIFVPCTCPLRLLSSVRPSVRSPTNERIFFLVVLLSFDMEFFLSLSRNYCVYHSHLSKVFAIDLTSEQIVICKYLCMCDNDYSLQTR